MNNKIKNYLLSGIFIAIIGIFSALYFIKGSSDFSEAERRTLAKFPEISVESLTNGQFMKDFESFSLDQFPARDGMRSVKSVFERFIFANRESNDLYYHAGHIASVLYPLDKEMLDYALDRFNNLYDMYADEGMNVYFSMIPDKSAYLADDAGVLSVDYDEFIDYMISGMPENIGYIDVSSLLSADDFYYTDQHWRQENIADVANALSTAMGNPLDDEYETVTLDTPFYGTYYHQAAIPGVSPDSISYLTNKTIEGCTVSILDDYGNFKESVMYELSYAQGRDPYEMYLSGARALITIENPNADTDKQLVVFRDSFGSSIIPLLAESYAKITLCDIRYTSPASLAHYVDFENCDDMLFLYSTLIVDAATALRK